MRLNQGDFSIKKGMIFKGNRIERMGENLGVSEAE